MLFALILVGCAGATETELFEQPVTESGTTIPPANSPNDNDGPMTPGPTTPTTPTTPTNPTPPKPACATEVEPNNNRQNPTTFTSCVSGKLANGTDVDNLVIKAPAKAKAMVIKTSGEGGRVAFQLTGGGLFGLNEQWTDDDPPGNVPVNPDDTYLFQVRSGGGGGEKSWKVDVIFE